MTDRELLKKAASVAGYGIGQHRDGYSLTLGGVKWDPLNDNGDAFRLALSIGMTVSPGQAVARKGVYAACSSMNQSIEEATRRAIVVAAASLAEKPTPQN